MQTDCISMQTSSRVMCHTACTCTQDLGPLQSLIPIHVGTAPRALQACTRHAMDTGSVPPILAFQTCPVCSNKRRSRAQLQQHHLCDCKRAAQPGPMDWCPARKVTTVAAAGAGAAAGPCGAAGAVDQCSELLHGGSRPRQHSAQGGACSMGAHSTGRGGVWVEL